MENDIVDLTRFADRYHAKWIVACNHHGSDEAVFETLSGISVKIQAGSKRCASFTSDNHILKINVPNISKIIGFTIVLHLNSDHFDAESFWKENFFFGCGNIVHIHDSNQERMELRMHDKLEPVMVKATTVTDVIDFHYRKSSLTPERHTIPKRFHFVWFGNKRLSKRNSIASWLRYHPNFEATVWHDENRTNEDMYDELSSKFRGRLSKRCVTPLFDCFPSALKKMWYEVPNPGFRSDIARYMILHTYGGVYVDVNDFEAMSSMDTWLRCFDFVCGTEPFLCTNVDILPLNNAFMASKPHHPILDRMLRLTAHQYECNPISNLLLKESTSNDEEYDNAIASISGVGILRMVVCGYFMENIGVETHAVVLPSVYIYPCCFYDPVTFLHRREFRGDSNDWHHGDGVTIAAHFSKHEYLTDVGRDGSDESQSRRS